MKARLLLSTIVLTSMMAGAPRAAFADSTSTQPVAPAKSTTGKPAGAASKKTSTKATTSKSATTARSTAAKTSTGAPDSRRLEDIHIEGEIPVPQVLFITAREQRRIVEFQHDRYRRSSRALGESTVLPARVAVANARTTPASATAEAAK